MSMVPAMLGSNSADAVSEELQERLAHLQRLGVGEQQEYHLNLVRKKLQDHKCVLAFCGHFSAGKSTLINRLAGGEVLPASPIPTSANQVLVRHGESSAAVRFRDQGEVLLPPADLHRLAALCKDGDQVDAVEVRYPLAHVPEGLWLMDTPGIDSTDEAHRTVTESALYLADAVFYVMDYNHVQSETNLQFTRRLAQWGKPLYLIVNQVDKHVELELSFAQFRQSVLQAFAAWGVQPRGLFFTSLREPDHPRNEWGALLETIQDLGKQQEQLLALGAWTSAAHIMQEEGRRRTEAQAPEREPLLLEVQAPTSAPHRPLALVMAEVERLSQTPKEAVMKLNRDVTAILANAPLFPFATRALAERYLLARKPGFRVGLFFAERKTAAEVQCRLHALHGDLSEKVTAHMVWPLQALLNRFAAEHDHRHEAFAAAVQALAVFIEPTLLAELVKPQAMVGQEYLYQYMKDVTEAVQLQFRRALKPLVDEADAFAHASIREAVQQLETEAALLTRAMGAAEQLLALDEAIQTFTATWSDILGPSPVGLRAAEGNASELVEEEPPPVPLAVPGMDLLVAKEHADTLTTRTGAQRQADADRLREAARLLTPVPGMSRAAADLEQRAQRLEESRFTVALFGAFSAGKSSFANALMGLPLLPVSPNPTTAVITRVEPPTAARPHGSVHVTWKSTDQLRQEIERALTALELHPTGDIAADLANGASQAENAAAPSAKPHAAFLTAAAKGYAAVRQRLGSQESANLADFASLVADEQRSCFVGEISVYVDCPLTRQGITLVDTPGADSVNARHTDVAFDYIKNADAVLFVTYYNHAFSRADREFLTQLGRVKDSFALDKMFFVINAADLAEGESELDLVIGHVRQNLQGCGVRQARIFPLSSQTALWSRLHATGGLPRDLTAKLERRLGMPVDAVNLTVHGLDASGMGRFEAAFYQFVVTDLSQMAVDSAMGELRRSTQMIATWLEASRADDGARAERIQVLHRAEAHALSAVAALDAAPELREVERHVDELLYYVRRRVLLERFRSMVVEAFNPTVLRDDSPDLKGALRLALNEVVQSIGFDLGQEMRATALRVENAVNRQAERFAQRATAAVQAHLPDWSAPAYSPIHLPVPAFSEGHDELAPERYQKLLGLFRNPKQFFTGGGRNELCDELAKALEDPVGRYLSAARTVLVGCYGSALEQRVAKLRPELGDSARDHVRGFSAVLMGTSQSEYLESVLDRLRE